MSPGRRKHSTSHISLLPIKHLLRLLESLHVRPLLFLRHTVVSLSSHSDNIRSTHVRKLFLYFDALALDEDVISISRTFDHHFSLIIISKRLIIARLAFFFIAKWRFGCWLCSSLEVDSTAIIVNVLIFFLLIRSSSNILFMFADMFSS